MHYQFRIIQIQINANFFISLSKLREHKVISSPEILIEVVTHRIVPRIVLHKLKNQTLKIFFSMHEFLKSKIMSWNTFYLQQTISDHLKTWEKHIPYVSINNP